MKEVSANRLSMQDVMSAKDASEVVKLYAGNPPLVTAFMLPMSFTDAIYEAFGGADGIRVGLDGMSATWLMGLVNDQVDKDGKQHRFGVLTANRADVAFIVAGNEYWRGRTCPRQQVDGCCGHPDAMSPECHEGVCPLVQREAGE